MAGRRRRRRRTAGDEHHRPDERCHQTRERDQSEEVMIQISAPGPTELLMRNDPHICSLIQTSAPAL